MKKLTLILFMLISQWAISQDFLTLKAEYTDWCNEIVNDTLQQKGEIYQGDTLWQDVYCKKYLNNNEGYPYILGGGSYITCDSISIGGYYGYYKPDLSQYRKRVYIYRDYICKIKREKSSMEGFWNWTSKKTEL